MCTFVRIGLSSRVVILSACSRMWAKTITYSVQPVVYGHGLSVNIDLSVLQKFVSRIVLTPVL